MRVHCLSKQNLQALVQKIKELELWNSDLPEEMIDAIQPKDKIIITCVMPCGCAVGTHPPDGHQHPASNCPMGIY